MGARWTHGRRQLNSGQTVRNSPMAKRLLFTWRSAAAHEPIISSEGSLP